MDRLKNANLVINLVQLQHSKVLISEKKRLWLSSMVNTTTLEYYRMTELIVEEKFGSNGVWHF